jgi:hypothetical protein
MNLFIFSTFLHVDFQFWFFGAIFLVKKGCILGLFANMHAGFFVFQFCEIENLANFSNKIANLY